MSQTPIIAIPTQTAATITSAAIPVGNAFSCSLQVNSTGAAAGTAVIQASNDHIPGDFATLQAPTNWTAITGITVTVTTAGSVLIPKFDLSYQYIRVVYTNTGTGTVQAVLSVTGI